MENKPRFFPILRFLGDIGIVWVSMIVISELSARLAPQTEFPIDMVALVGNALGAILGFFVVALRTRENRWRHLALILVAVWLVLMIRLLPHGAPASSFLSSLVMLTAFAALGGGLAELTRRIFRHA